MFARERQVEEEFLEGGFVNFSGDLVVDPVEQSGHGGRDGGSQGLVVVRQILDVPPIEAHGPPGDIHGHLASALQHVRQGQE